MAVTRAKFENEFFFLMYDTKLGGIVYHPQLNQTHNTKNKFSFHREQQNLTL